jgi:hypothetical protein
MQPPFEVQVQSFRSDDPVANRVPAMPNQVAQTLICRPQSDIRRVSELWVLPGGQSTEIARRPEVVEEVGQIREVSRGDRFIVALDTKALRKHRMELGDRSRPAVCIDRKHGYRRFDLGNDPARRIPGGSTAPDDEERVGVTRDQAREAGLTQRKPLAELPSASHPD